LLEDRTTTDNDEKCTTKDMRSEFLYSTCFCQICADCSSL